jgi:hypothetical protein
MDNKKTNKDSLDVAGRIYEVEDYKREDTLSSGLAKTHEQVSDTFTEGEIQPVINDVNGKDIKVKREGLEGESH